MDRLARTVREQVALGRLLPLGGPADAAWITESAAVAALRRAVESLPGVRLGAVALELADAPDGDADEEADDKADGAAVRGGGAAPLGALPYRPIRLSADFAAGLDEPLPRGAERLRAALWAAARDGLGLPVASVDLAVTGLLDGPPAPPAPDEVREGVVVDDGPARAPEEPDAGAAARVASAVLAVPGVLRLTRHLANLGAGVRIRDTPATPEAAPARRVQLQLAVSPTHRPHEVARAATSAATSAAAADAPGPVTTAVVVTATTP